jgi:hypothetical protein
MDAPPSSPSLGAGWIVICGVAIAGAALKEAVRLVGDSPLAPKRPSMSTMLITGFLLKTAVSRLGGGALGLPPGA